MDNVSYISFKLVAAPGLPAGQCAQVPLGAEHPPAALRQEAHEELPGVQLQPEELQVVHAYGARRHQGSQDRPRQSQLCRQPLPGRLLPQTEQTHHIH